MGISPQEARAELWRRGNLRWKLFADQVPVYLDLRGFLDNPATAYEVFYLDITRQWGKTFIGCLVATEYAIRHPGSEIRYVSYTKEGLREFVHPNMRELLRDCPDEIKPRWVRHEAKYHFPNGSNIHMAGANNGHEDDSRGPRAHFILIEEAAFVDRLNYLVSSVLTPQLTTTGGRILMISTPPISPAHDVASYKLECEGRGNYAKRTIDQNEHLSDGAKAKLIKELGGRDSTQARRELWCEWVVDETRAIVPEFSRDDRASRIVQPAPPLTWEQPTIAMDVGFEDFHAILYGYWHFGLAKLVIQAEDVLQRATTDRIASAIKATEERLWRTRRSSSPVARWSDVDLRLIADLSAAHRLSVSPTRKDDLEAQVNALRMLVKDERIIIDPSCKATVRHLKMGVWNKARTQFERTELEGHFDTVAALIYLLRNVDRFTNPYPRLPEGVTEQTHWLGRQRADQVSPEAAALGAAFRSRR